MYTYYLQYIFLCVSHKLYLKQLNFTVSILNYHNKLFIIVKYSLNLDNTLTK